MHTETLDSAATVELFNRFVIPNYPRFPVSLVRGEGSYVWDSEGNRYLDLFPGWGCNLLGIVRRQWFRPSANNWNN
ncbi:MAG: hypothetical protein VB875_19545 [Pirellulales bacterium]